jgi:hypothetical protein
MAMENVATFRCWLNRRHGAALGRTDAALFERSESEAEPRRQLIMRRRSPALGRARAALFERSESEAKPRRQLR